MFLPPADRTLGDDEWRPWVAAQGFGQLVPVAAGADGWPVIVPMQFACTDDGIEGHLAAPNPALKALAHDPRAVLSVVGDWAYIPSDWKVTGAEDPRLGIPTTYYAAVQLRGRVRVVDDPDELAATLRRQLVATQPGVDVADPAVAHRAKLAGIRGVRLTVDGVVAKFKYGGNVDAAHRRAVAERLDRRDGPGDAAAAGHLRRRSAARAEEI